MRSYFASPHRACRDRSHPPPWAPPFSAVPQVCHNRSLRLRLSRTWGIPVSFSSFIPATGRPRFARTPRSRASLWGIMYARSPLPPDGDRRFRADYFLPGRPIRDAPALDAFLPIASGASQTTASRRLLCPCGLSNLFFLCCPVPADFAPLRLPRPGVAAVVAVTCGHGNRLLIVRLLRDAADTSCAVTAASLRLSSIISPLTGDLGSLGRRSVGISCAVSPDSPCLRP